jgi:hypothetical protein
MVDVREEFRVMKWIYNELLYFAKFVRRMSTGALSAMDTIPSRACDYDQAHFRPCILDDSRLYFLFFAFLTSPDIASILQIGIDFSFNFSFVAG